MNIAMSPLAFALALASLHPALGPGRPDPTFYSCDLVRTLPSGELSVLVSGPGDGSETYYRAQWASTRTGPGPGLNLRWHGLAEPGGDAAAQLYFIIEDRIGYAPVELRGPRGEALLSGFPNDSGPVEGGGWAYGGRFQWGEIVGLVRANDGVVAALAPGEAPSPVSGRIDPAMIEAPAAAIAAARGEIERIARERSCGAGRRLRI
jgi:hypothetical protein